MTEPTTNDGEPTKARDKPPPVTSSAHTEPSTIIKEILETSGHGAPDFGVSAVKTTAKSPRVDNDTSESPEVINLQPDSKGGQRDKSTRGLRGKKGVKSASKSTTAKARQPRPTKARKSKTKPPVPDGFEPRQRDNRWQLFKLLGKKLSSKGKTMWRRAYIGSFTEEGLKKFHEREQQRIKDESTGQRTNVVNLSDRKRGGRDVEQGRQPSRKKNP